MENINEKLLLWANTNGYWAKALLKECKTSGEISAECLMNILREYEDNSFSEIPNAQETTNISGKLYLKSIKDVEGVNKLLSNQTMTFNSNLSVIYGSNGTGKTGYVRIIKSLGDCLDIENAIYSDLTQEEIFVHSAKLSYIDDENEKTIDWSNSTDEKLNLKVFNSNCVRFSLDNKKQVQFIPQEFNSFNILNSATTELAKLAKDRTVLLQSSFNRFGIIDGTEVCKLIDNLNRAKSVKDQIDGFIIERNLNIEDLSQRVKKIEKISSELNFKTIDLEISRFAKLKSKLEEINVFVFIKSEIYNQVFWKNYKQYLTQISGLIKSNVNLEDFIEGLDLEEKQKRLFKSFLLAADEYQKSVSSKNLNEENSCIFCKQPFNEHAKKLMDTYSRFISNDNTRKILYFEDKIKEVITQIDGFIIKIENLLTNFETEDEELYRALLTLVENLRELKSINYSENIDFNKVDALCNFDKYKDIITGQLKTYEDKLTILSSNRGNLEKILSENRNQLNELNSMMSLLNNKGQITNNLQSQINVYPLTKISNSSLSAIQTNILTANYKTRFKQILQDNLIRLEAPSNIKFEPSIISSKLALRQSFLDKQYNLGSILSEGEQKVIALAHFLTENSMEDKDNILVLDDPVNSLDLQRMEVVARVLVELSLDKQVIIFTHNLVFVGFLSYYAKSLLETGQQTYISMDKIKVEGKEYTGLIKYEFPNIETYSNYSKILKHKMTNASNSSLTKQDMYDCFSYIRSAVELLVVEKVFNGTVNRYEPDIKMTRFERIKTDKLKDHGSRISALFYKVCRFIPAHSSSPQARIEPCFNDLEECYKEMLDIEREFR